MALLKHGNTMAGLHFDITADNTNLMQKLKDTERGIEDVSKRINNEGGGIEALFSRMTKAAAAFGAGFTAQELVRNIIKVRGEFQQLEVAFTTMLGSEEKATALMSQLTETAAKTPFDLQGVANGARQLLAYGTEAEDVNETLIRLGNIAAGLSIPLNDLVYLYGTTMTQGRLYTQDLNQFTGRGIPMIRELAKEFGVAESEIKSMVEAGRIGFPEVQKVINNLTNEGGMFYNLMEEQSKTITGQISNIGDSFSMMLNDIGKANEGIINDALSGVSYLIENYETVGKTLLEIVGTYGAYRAALITITALQKAYNILMAQAAIEQNLAAIAGHKLTNAQALAAARTKLLQVAQAALNKTLLANPYAAVAAAVAALGFGIYKLVTYQTEAEKAQERLNEAVRESEKASLSEQRELARLKGELSALKEGTDEYNSVKEKIISGYGKYYNGLEEEINRVGLTTEAYEKLTKAIVSSYGARQYDKFKSQQEGELDETMSENLAKIQDRLIEKLGEEYGAKYYAKIRDAILQGNLKIGKTHLSIEGLDSATMLALDKVAGDGWIKNRSVEAYILNILKAINLTEKLDQEARERFGITDNTVNENANDNDETKQNLLTLDELIEKIKAAESNLKSLRQQAQQGLIDTSKVKEASAELQTLTSQYKTMTGLEWGAKGRTPAKDNGKDAEEERLEAERKAGEMLVELRKENDQAYVDAMQDGTLKKIAQIVLDYKEQKAEVDRQEAELRELNKKSGEKNVGDDGLTDEQRDELNQKRANIEENTDKAIEEAYDSEFDAEEKAMNEYLKKYGDYQQKRQAIAEEYEQKIAAATNEWDKKLLEKERDSALKGLDEQYKGTTKAMADLFEDASEKSVSAIQKIIDKYELLVQYLSGTKKGDNTTVTMDELKDIGFTDDDIEKIKNGEISIKDLTDAIKKLKDELKGKSPWQSFISDMENAIEKLKSAAGDMSKIGEGITGIGNAVTAFAPALGEFGANIASIFGAEDTNITEIANAIGGLGQTAAGVGQIMAGDIVGGVMSAVGGISSIVGAFKAIHDKKNEERIQDLQDRIDALGNSYDRLGKEIEKSYSTDTAKLYGEQNEVLEQQKKLIEQQIAEEEDKKDTDDDRIKQWKEELQDINDQIEENKEAAKDAIFGEDLQSAIENFSSAWADAWTNGTNRVKSVRDVVRSMMQKMVEESINAAISASGAMEQIRKKMAEFYSDGVFQDWEQEYLYKMAEDLQKDLDRQFGWAGDSLYKDDSPQEQQSATRGFSTEMTQDQASELSGRFTALQETGMQILSTLLSMQSITVSVTEQNTILSEIRNLAVTSNGYLESISGYQKKIFTNLESSLLEISTTLKNKL